MDRTQIVRAMELCPNGPRRRSGLDPADEIELVRGQDRARVIQLGAQFLIGLRREGYGGIERGVSLAPARQPRQCERPDLQRACARSRIAQRRQGRVDFGDHRLGINGNAVFRGIGGERRHGGGNRQRQRAEPVPPSHPHPRLAPVSRRPSYLE